MTGDIFHLAKSGDWAGSTDTYRPPSVDEDGFVHCSTAEQLPRVAIKRFVGQNDLILLTIDPDQLGDESLVDEGLYELGEEFPIFGWRLRFHEDTPLSEAVGEFETFGQHP